MLALAFDTLKLARKWESAGVAPKQAQEMTAALSESLAELVTVGNLATKDDIAKLETKIEATKAEILKWMFGAIGTQTVVLLGALLGLNHYPGLH
jgi:hypothetical protein